MRVDYLDAGERLTAETLGREPFSSSEANAVAADIIKTVRQAGDAALVNYTKQFDKAERKSLEVSPLEIEKAWRDIDANLRDALEYAANAIRDFHERQKTQSWFVTRPDGAMLGSKLTALKSVGIYVPGGRAPYPSTVLMNALPAQVAGVKRIIMVTPPKADGSIDKGILAAAKLAGITEIYAVGGAQAIAALAYGTESIDPVDKIFGPGNAYVAAAKRLVSGDVGIDMIAGPSEVAILADESSDASLVAIDLLAQAEHDPDACTFLITTDEALVDEVIERIEHHLAFSSRQEITKQSIDNNCLVLVCDDLPTAISAVNDIAPEHLEIHMDQPLELLGLIENVGAVFLGPWTPQSVGDYTAGPNHTLPTNSTARWESPLSVDDFVKRTSVVSYSYAALSNDAPYILALAKAEGFWAHGRAVELRFEEEDD
ncbi:MAG: histidinol dehydrogenase [Coriobacteriales bacterium]|jgi:histidinol dehydrogenase|nr:histidinol dehydrogenase [Coriobacteriales bacterium]